MRHRLTRRPPCPPGRQDDFKYLAKKISKKVLEKESGPWSERTQRKIHKYVEGTFQKSFVFQRAAGEEEED